MNISKAGLALAGGEPGQDELEQIRRYARAELAPEEVYTFPVILCDNEIDRDYERFDEGTLEQLVELFVGKTGISDHEWRSGNQVARIYRTEIVREPEKKTAAGDGYVAVKAWAYMLRTESNAALIADIEGGIKKEVSVGCAVKERLCSVCGRPIGAEGCEHVKGETYGGRLCHAVLSGAADAYEWSFVAVPAQRGAGVTKAAALVTRDAAQRSGRGPERKNRGADMETSPLMVPAHGPAERARVGEERLASGRSLARQGEAEQSEPGSDEGGMERADSDAALRKEAALGRRYLASLQTEVKRLALICGRDFYEAAAPALASMDADALLGLKAAFEKRAASILPLPTQLHGANAEVRFDGDAYRV